jgi:hypothetical protein
LKLTRLSGVSENNNYWGCSEPVVEIATTQLILIIWLSKTTLETFHTSATIKTETIPRKVTIPLPHSLVNGS